MDIYLQRDNIVSSLIDSGTITFTDDNSNKVCEFEIRHPKNSSKFKSYTNREDNDNKFISIQITHIRVETAFRKKGIMKSAFAYIINTLLENEEYKGYIKEINVVQSIPSIMNFEDKNKVYKKILPNIKDANTPNAKRWVTLYPENIEADKKYYQSLYTKHNFLNLNIDLTLLEEHLNHIGNIYKINTTLENLNDTIFLKSKDKEIIERYNIDILDLFYIKSNLKESNNLNSVQKVFVTNYPTIISIYKTKFGKYIVCNVDYPINFYPINKYLAKRIYKELINSERHFKKDELLYYYFQQCNNIEEVIVAVNDFISMYENYIIKAVKYTQIYKLKDILR